ncbi:hypothetical protein ACWEP8_27200 [Streptomyces hydrogenans]
MTTKRVLVARAMVRQGKGGGFRDPARVRAHRIGAAREATG